MPHFECGAFNHSATSPHLWLALSARGRLNSGSRASAQVPKCHAARHPFRDAWERLNPHQTGLALDSHGVLGYALAHHAA